MRAPMKPSATPIQRRTPTSSLRMGIDSTVTRIGVVNMMAVAVASGSSFTPALNTLVVSMRISDRAVCRIGARLLSRSGRSGPAIAAAKKGCKEEPRPGDFDEWIGGQQEFHRGVERDEAEHRRQH